jgi:phosphatidate phosphatase APP1
MSDPTPVSPAPAPQPPGAPRARRLLDALRDAWQRWDDARPPYRVVGHRGYATPGGSAGVGGVGPRALVLARAHAQAAIAPADAAHSPWVNLRATLARLTHDPLPHARVRATLDGRAHDLVADDEGFVHAWLALDAPLAPGAWHDVTFALEAPDRARVGEATGARVLAPAATAAYGVVSDLDDTVLQSDVARFTQAARLVLFENARTRLPFPGVAAFYRALAAGRSGADNNPVFYVSSSPWNLYDVIADFLDARGLPQGPILLRDWDLGRELARTEAFKLARIRELFDAFPALPFVLVGDSAQADPEVYAEVARHYPGRVLAVYIRDVTRRPERGAAIARLAEALGSAGTPLVLADDTVAAARDAAARGLVGPATVDAVAADVGADAGAPG